jgi:hypothetical protein
VQLLSRSQTGSVGVSHSATLRWNFGLSAGYTQYSDLMQTIGKYRSYNAGAGFTYQLNDWAHIVGRYDARRYNAGEAICGGRPTKPPWASLLALGIYLSPCGRVARSVVLATRSVVCDSAHAEENVGTGRAQLIRREALPRLTPARRSSRPAIVRSTRGKVCPWTLSLEYCA